MEAPIETKVLAKQPPFKTEGTEQRIQVPVLDIALDDDNKPNLLHENGRLRVAVDVGADGLNVTSPFPSPTPVPLDVDLVAKSHPDVKELDGLVPPGSQCSFTPTEAPSTHVNLDGSKKSKDVDPNGIIFDRDDRTLFQDTKYPWRTVGKVRTAGGWGSGAMIGSRLVLTASSIINWNSDGRGNVGWVTFTPGYYDGRGPWGEFAASKVVYYEKVSGNLTDLETAFDYVILVLAQPIGNTIGYVGAQLYQSPWNNLPSWQCVGYGQDRARGERPLYQGGAIISSVQPFTLNGNSGYVLGHFNDFTPGEGGAPAWGYFKDDPSRPRVVGVGSTIGSTAVERPTGSTNRDNEYAGGPALNKLILEARANYP
ncbi:hypothetical protein PENARI_c046G08165 [Penicillium arizonense]|uniref:Uncharacterized protein n=1 Tax=Penicillium arizonense TaxID=1835702 RepID=A0A1F5L2B8_PENAI|nr:hypothetical protein PENARI_c046G08165 [Penicillium arizonense]OGE47388.1 hypothetical protein PENARI_c046G08165 [Penicillium arizonense]